ncbi:MAG: hypothetical protein ABIJ97_03315 [Bacteroidota bacterium]
MKNYTDIKHKSIFITMGTLLYFFPIGIITHNIWTSIYGNNYEICYTWEKIVNIDAISNIYAFLIFCTLSFFAWGFQKYVYPAIIIGFMNNKNMADRKLNDLMQELSTESNLNKMSNILRHKPLLYPTIIILWLISINSLVFYLIAFFIFIVTIIFSKKYFKIMGYNLYETD